MKMILDITEQYRVDTEEEVKDFIEEIKENGVQEGYIVKNYSSSFKEKKSKGETVDQGYLLKITKSFNTFWEV